jgi:hypothetical protein
MKVHIILCNNVDGPWIGGVYNSEETACAEADGLIDMHTDRDSFECEVYTHEIQFDE